MVRPTPPTSSEKWSVWFCEEQLFSFGERTFVDSFKFKLFIGSVSEWEPANEILCGSLIGFVGLGRQCSSKFIPNFSIPTCLMKHSIRIFVLPDNNKSNQPDFTTVALTMCCFNWHTHNRKQFYAVFLCRKTHPTIVARLPIPNAITVSTSKDTGYTSFWECNPSLELSPSILSASLDWKWQWEYYALSFWSIFSVTEQGN